MKYISDYSLGAVECEYADIQGTCDLSKQWKEAFAKVCADHTADLKEIEIYDEKYVAKINDYLSDKGYSVFGTYSGVTQLTDYSEIIEMPPASSIPTIKEKHQTSLDDYNTYILN